MSPQEVLLIQFPYFCTMKPWLKIGIVLLVLFSADLCFGQGCSQCKLIAEQSAGKGGSDEATFGTNINYGILYLMAIPYLLLMLFFRKRIVSGFRSLIGK